MDSRWRAAIGRLSTSGGVNTLDEMRARGMTMLEVACRRCQRRGRLRIERLIAEHGAGCAIIAADCPRVKNPATSIYDRCGVHLYEAAALV